MPTKNLIGYVVVLVLSAAPAVMVNGPAGYLPVLAVLFFGAVSLLQLVVIKKYFYMDTDADERQREREESSGFVLRLENRCILPLPNFSAVFTVKNLNSGDCHRYPVHLTMSPKEKRKFELEADFSHIGIFEAGLQDVRLFDLLGVWQVERRMEEPSRVSVLPKQYVLERMPVSEKTIVESIYARTPVAFSGSDYVGVREYEFGDPMKMVQWKLSAHTQTLMTKQMETYTNVGITAVLDLRVPDYAEEIRLDIYDAVMETGAAVADYAQSNGMDFDMYFHGAKGKRRVTPASAADFSGFLEEAVMTDGNSGKSPSDILREDCAYSRSQSNIVLCTALPDEDTVSSVLYLKQRGKNPLLYLLVPAQLTEQEKAARLAPLHILQNENISVLSAADAEGVVMA